MAAIVVGNQVTLSDEYESQSCPDAGAGPLTPGVVGLVTRVDEKMIQVQGPDGQKCLYAREALIHVPSIESVPSASTDSDAAAPAVESAAAEGAAGEWDDDEFDEDEADDDEVAAEEPQRESCVLCGHAFIGQARVRRPDGTEVHGECLELHRLQPRKVTSGGSGGQSTGAAAADTIARRGTCALCGDDVFETELRLRGQAKADYVHERCYRRLEITEAAAASWSESSPTASGSTGSSSPVGTTPSGTLGSVSSKLKRALSPRSRNALTMFGESAATSAADVAFAEELLMCGATKLNEEERKQLRTAVAMGELGTAGTLYVGQTLSAPSASVAADSGSSHGTTSGAHMCPICFDTVEIEGAAVGSGGAVSCLSGHAMHAACASGLALSGGACPECREPLFFTKLNPVEASTADAQASLVAVNGSLVAGNGGCSNGGGGGGGGHASSSSSADTLSSSTNVTVNGVGAPMRQSPENGKWYCGLRKMKMKKKMDSGRENASPKGRETEDDKRLYVACGPHDGPQCRSCKEWTAIAKATNGAKAAGMAAAHMVRLRTELATVKAARAQAQAEMVEELENREATGDSGRGGGGGGSNKEHVPPAIKCDDCNDQLSVPPAPPTLQRQITPGSTDAIDFLLDKVMGADYHRGRHLLALAAQWGDAPDAVAARSALHESAKAGDLDSVARAIRARNASLAWEHGAWADVVMSDDTTTITTTTVNTVHSSRGAEGSSGGGGSREWTVSSVVSNPLPLRCSAKATSRPTGYFLKTGQRFTAAKEWLDPKTGNLWLKLAKKQTFGGDQEDARQVGSGGGAGTVARGRRERSESPVRDEGSNNSSNSRLVSGIPQINDEGAPVSITTRPGSGDEGKYYCGRRLGRSMIPGSDGQCGPNNGPQCASCLRYMAWMKHEALMMLPPDEHAGEWRGSSKHQWCSLASSRDGLICTHGGRGPGGLVLSKHWSCCGSARPDAPCTMPPTKESSKLLLATQPLQAGDLVVLSKEYQSCGDAAGGPLKEGDVGVVDRVRGSSSGQSISVRRLPKAGETSNSSSTWWYSKRALKRAPLPGSPLEEAKKKNKEKEKEAAAAAATTALLLPGGQKACGACTFYNEPSRTACEMCGTALVLPPAVVEEEKASSMLVPELNLTEGTIVHMQMGDGSADWTGFWGEYGNRLSFSADDEYTVSEVRGQFFRSSKYATLWAPISATDFAPCATAPVAAPPAAPTPSVEAAAPLTVPGTAPAPIVEAASSSAASSDENSHAWVVEFPSPTSTLRFPTQATRMYQVGNGCEETFEGLRHGTLLSSTWEMVVDRDFSGRALRFEVLVNECVVGQFSVPGKQGRSPAPEHVVLATCVHRPGLNVGPSLPPLQLEVRAMDAVPPGGGNYLLLTRGGRVTFYDTPTPPSPAASATTTAAAAAASAGSQCPSGHTLLPFTISDSVSIRCDECDCSLPPGTSNVLSCRGCDYDRCSSCSIAAGVPSSPPTTSSVSGSGSRSSAVGTIPTPSATTAAAAAEGGDTGLLQEGDACVLAAGYGDLPGDAARGPLMPGGPPGVVSTTDASSKPLLVSGWWYERAALCRPGAPNAALRPSGSPTRRLAVGDRCELTPDAFDYDDASDGPLAFGDVGEVEEVEDDPDDNMPYNVSFNGRTHWYNLRAVQLVGGSGSALGSGSSGHGERLTVELLRSLARNTPLMFAPLGGSYPSNCVFPASVTFLQTSGEGTRSAQVRWPSGFTYWVKLNDLALPSADSSAASRLPPPPQGWLLLRPGGPGTPAVAQQSTSFSASRCSLSSSSQKTRKGLRCFGCGHGLLPPLESALRLNPKQGYTPGNANTLKVGQTVLVASTLEPAVVVALVDATNDDLEDNGTKRGLASSSGTSKSAAEGAVDAHKNARAELGKRAVVVFPNERDTVTTFSDDEEEEEDARFSFECSALLVPGVGLDEMKMINGFPRSRYESWLLHQRDVTAAKAAWDEAPSWEGPPGSTCSATALRSGSDFASCVRGHLLHAHCFQRALLEGAGCPVCPEPLFVPRVERTDRADDDCRDVVEDGTASANSSSSSGGGGGGGGPISREARTGSAAADALQAARAVESEAAAMLAPSSGKENGGGSVTSIRSVAGKQLRMCPSCCAGPLFNENCSDMRAHHGQCPNCSSKIRNADAVIASALASVSFSTSVMALLPSCPNGRCKGAKVLFNGCAACGHLFAGSGDNEWDRLPLWDPNAASDMALDAKARSAARLLAAQVRYEASHLEHERRALRAARSSLALSAEDLVELEPPLPLPPTSRWMPPKPPGCGPTCGRSHSGDGDCLVCGQGWGNHNGHNCSGGRGRGSWRV